MSLACARDTDNFETAYCGYCSRDNAGDDDDDDGDYCCDQSDNVADDGDMDYFVDNICLGNCVAGNKLMVSLL